MKSHDLSLSYFSGETYSLGIKIEISSLVNPLLIFDFFFDLYKTMKWKLKFHDYVYFYQWMVKNNFKKISKLIKYYFIQKQNFFSKFSIIETRGLFSIAIIFK